MGFLSAYSATETVDLSNEEGSFSATVKVYLPSAQFQAAQKKLLKMGADATGTMSTDIDSGAYLLELAAQALVSWNLTDENDVVLPAATIEQRRASMERLPNFMVEKIAGAVQDKPRTKEEAAAFPDEPTASDPAE